MAAASIVQHDQVLILIKNLSSLYASQRDLGECKSAHGARDVLGNYEGFEETKHRREACRVVPETLSERLF